MDPIARYLELLKKSLLDELYIENEARLVYMLLARLTQSAVDDAALRDIARHQPNILAQLREARREGNISFRWKVTTKDGVRKTIDLRRVTEVYHTMIGRKRLDNLHQALDSVVAENILGDVIETGVWRGGATIFMRGYLAVHGIKDRAVWLADSFQGLPAPSLPQDAGHDFSAQVCPGLSISRADVQALFERYDLMDDSVKFLEGWFKDTLATAPIDRLAVLRLDGDLYESTMDALTPLYPKVSSGGWIIVDDYNDFEPCRRAVNEYRQRHGITAPLQKIDWTAVYWRKQ